MNRAVSLDVLRGLSIFGMILSGTIPFGNVLPAWMYHAQCPPPSHAFNPEIAGITWVDLVLPVFIFCMGAAIPLALGKKLEKGQTIGEITRQILTRFSVLVLFAIYIAHIMPHAIGKGFWNLNLLGTDVKGYDLQIFTLLGFLLMFPMFAVIRDAKKKIIYRIAGWGGAILLLLIFRFTYGQEFSLHRSNIIILLLAGVYFLGAISWLISRNNTTARLAIFIFWAAVQVLSKHTGLGIIIENYQPISWFFKLSMSFYMLLLIPATMVGDIIAKRLKSSEEFSERAGNGNSKHIFFAGVLAVSVWLTISLFARWTTAVFIVTPATLIFLYLLVTKYIPGYRQMFTLAAYLIIIGLMVEPVEGGIKKDYVTVSYLLITAGISINLLMFLDYVVAYFRNSRWVKLFEGAGSNPLMAYVMSTWFMFPLLHVSFLIGFYNVLYPSGYPWIGVLRAACLVMLIMVVVNRMVRKKIVWRV
ncbi:DUF5009 domain-containing protein [Maribellus luteus]|uniref:DUF5009 domain-containing protein n=1 Tax=Maribellus luteus TaxID=2305463 RepID=A0A399SVY6_9BACT|nr:DUF5009 domain-containing protein [Maribellus luteus]RIJ46117.1 DUF5009 domain-containing protein [Maribellus luteus]